VFNEFELLLLELEFLSPYFEPKKFAFM